MRSSNKNPAMRRYLRRLAISMTFYMAFLFIALRYVNAFTGPVAYILGALPGIAVLGVFWAIGRLLIEETDEYLRMLLVRQTLVASAFSLSIATVYGFLENMKLVPHVDAFYITVLWFVGLGVGSLVNYLTLGDSGDCK